MTQNPMLYSDLMRKHVNLLREFKDLEKHYNELCKDHCAGCGNKLLWGEEIVTDKTGTYHVHCKGGA